MNILVVRIGDIKGYPPTISLINALHELGHNVTILTTLDSKGCESSFTFDLNIWYFDYVYKNHRRQIDKLLNLKRIHDSFWEQIDQRYDNESIIWCESDITIKHLGYKLIGYNYILRLDELNESLYYSSKLKLFHFDTARLGNNALAVVVPEYNRAHITRVWWGLKDLPQVLPNKPFTPHEDIAFSNRPPIIDEIIRMAEGRKIILYQGALNNERPIEPFLKAIETMDDYCSVVMSKNSKSIKGKYSNCICVDFIQPPFHLLVTELAYIGIICYRPDKEHNSALNTLYCAPNKIYEYSKYGIPIIGNDLPGLNYIFTRYNSGMTTKLESSDSIIETIKRISSNYELYSTNAKKMYDSVDMLDLIDNILDKCIKLSSIKIKDPKHE